MISGTVLRPYLKELKFNLIPTPRIKINTPNIGKTPTSAQTQYLAKKLPEIYASLFNPWKKFKKNK